MPENNYALHRGAANNPTRKHRYNGHVYCDNAPTLQNRPISIDEHRPFYFLVLKIAAFYEGETERQSILYLSIGANLIKRLQKLIIMDAKQFFKRVSYMRKLQKEYFQTRSSTVLRQCKQVEKEIDDEIERANKIVAEQQQPKLF